MKYLIISLVIAISFSSNALDLKIEWTKSLSKKVHVVCEDDVECNEAFGFSAVITEKICKDCFSTDLNSTFVFQAIGESFGILGFADSVDFFAFLKMNNFVSINFDTPFDLISSDSRMARRLRYRSICPDASVDPILFFEKNKSGAFGKARYVYCGDGVYDLDIFSVDINDQFSGRSLLY